MQHTSHLKTNNQNALFPGLTNFRHTSPGHRSNQDHGLQRELPTTGKQTKLARTVAADSQVVNCNRFSYQQVIHIHLHCKLAKANLTSFEQTELGSVYLLSSTYSMSVHPDRQAHQ